MSANTYTLRPFATRDAEAIARLFHDTIHTINLGDYSPEQVAAWAPADLHHRDWVAWCSDRLTVVAEQDGLVAGYAQLEPNGHIQHFYVHHLRQRQGVGRLLYDALEAEARRLGLTRLFTEASITARPFFERMGHRTLHARTVTVRGQTFVNYAMEKLLIPGCASGD